MPCNCGGNASKPVQYRLTLPSNSHFSDGSQQKTYATASEAQAAAASYPGAVVAAISG